MPCAVHLADLDVVLLHQGSSQRAATLTSAGFLLAVSVAELAMARCILPGALHMLRTPAECPAPQTVRCEKAAQRMHCRWRSITQSMLLSAHAHVAELRD